MSKTANAFIKRQIKVQRLYRKCPKFLNTKVSDKMTYANCPDSDQAEGAV